MSNIYQIHFKLRDDIDQPIAIDYELLQRVKTDLTTLSD